MSEPHLRQSLAYDLAAINALKRHDGPEARMWIERDINGRAASADLLADEQHRRLVALALADHDGALDRHLVQLAAHGVDGGLVGGLNMSSMTDMGSTSMHPGFAIGLYARRALNDTWALQVEGHYSGKGVEVKESGVTAKLEMDYFELPMLLRASMSGTEKTHAFFDIGAAPAFKSGCSVSASGGGTSIGFGCNGGTESFDLGAREYSGLTPA